MMTATMTVMTIDEAILMKNENYNNKIYHDIVTEVAL